MCDTVDGGKIKTPLITLHWPSPWFSLLSSFGPPHKQGVDSVCMMLVECPSIELDRSGRWTHLGDVGRSFEALD